MGKLASSTSDVHLEDFTPFEDSKPAQLVRVLLIALLGIVLVSTIKCIALYHTPVESV